MSILIETLETKVILVDAIKVAVPKVVDSKVNVPMEDVVKESIQRLSAITAIVRVIQRKIADQG